MLGLGIVLVVVVYAYGFDVTQVNLGEFRDEDRLESRVRVTRALAKPDILEYDKEEFVVVAPISIPCPPSGIPESDVDTTGPYMILSPSCGEPGEELTIQGFNFEPATAGPLFFIPYREDEREVRLSLKLDNQTIEVEPDANGEFEAIAEIPDRPSDQTQYVMAVTRKNVGLPHLTETAYVTLDKIIETVFLALLATTIGTILAVPVSFTAARNIMSDVQTPLASIALAVIGWIVGIGVAFLAVQWVLQASEMLTSSLALNLGSLVVSPLVVWGTARWALPSEELEVPGTFTRIARIVAMFIAGLATIMTLYLLGSLAVSLGMILEDLLGPLGFLGNFVVQLGDILIVIIPLFAALAGGAIVSSGLGKIGHVINENFSVAVVRVINGALSAIATALIFVILGAIINWLYEINDPLITFWIPAAIGAGIGVLLSLRFAPKDPVPIGTTIYYISRTILNALRSIEPLIMAIVAVIWVGIGPFAGVLALALHTVAALGKLYSEQVESISPGPLEAIKASGATRLQTIIYAVIPQIVPPYIAFTMYRWDINVRMSTIIGFVGGGGIGFLLSQNINLLNYRAAAAQMFAIAIVVATMDYVSSILRQRFI